MMIVLAPPAVRANPINSWEHRCFSQEETTRDMVCATELRARDSDKEILLYFARGRSGPIPLVAQGENLPFSEMVVWVDDQSPVKADHCRDSLCYYEKEKAHRLIRQFKRGKSATVQITGPENHIVFQQDITLMGFTAAFGMYR